MSLKFTHFKCPLIKPISVGDVILNSREWIEIDSGYYKVDLAPLPGLHRETLMESFADFKSHNTPKTPSALFAKEAMSLKVELGAKSKINLLDFIDLAISPNDYLLSWKDQESVKLKIGRNDLSLEAKWLKEITSKISNKLKLRLDGNLQFKSLELIEYLKNIDSSKIEYLEEPLSDLSEWPSVFKQINIPLALDENIDRRTTTPGVVNIVVKPTFNLSLENTLREIREENFQITISSSFDPPNNLAILHALGSLTKGHSGLDTLKYFNLEELISSPL
ncbi:hypothetical protein A9Q84_18030 [Halobacteriovorax marinus]|uniref:Enolase C-terminal domain-containing protein n=1 Tax=Halobacteriovorax marinus TaxID=97084 RepID=A0A1Y5F3Q8_9BACT|nr:hypothetical protein A9Q84_18030 [Halobacteriovorax marinus]